MGPQLARSFIRARYYRSRRWRLVALIKFLGNNNIWDKTFYFEVILVLIIIFYRVIFVTSILSIVLNFLYAFLCHRFYDCLHKVWPDYYWSYKSIMVHVWEWFVYKTDKILGYLSNYPYSPQSTQFCLHKCMGCLGSGCNICTSSYKSLINSEQLDDRQLIEPLPVGAGEEPLHK